MKKTLFALLLLSCVPHSPNAGGAGAPYTVKDGNKVDAATLEGWRTWRAMGCARCHGEDQDGVISLVARLKRLTKEQFRTTVLNGRQEKGMPRFGGIKQVDENIDNLYAYLKGRSDGAISAGRVERLE
jgi:mono/diheme cytochrome c family protein